MPPTMTIRDAIEELSKLAKQHGERTPIGFSTVVTEYGETKCERGGVKCCAAPMFRFQSGFITIEKL